MNRPQGRSTMQGRKLPKTMRVQRGSRRSIRLREYDYSRAGAYYFTVCTWNRECLLGNVADGHMQLNKAGEIALSVWNSLPKFYEGVELDAFIVMPNHIHGVIVIGARVGAIHELPLQPESPSSMRRTDRRRMLLSKVVGRFKMVASKEINRRRGTPGLPVWRLNYYEHVIRDEESLRGIRQYILDNPVQWELDPENPCASPRKTKTLAGRFTNPW